MKSWILTTFKLNRIHEHRTFTKSSVSLLHLHNTLFPLVVLDGTTSILLILVLIGYRLSWFNWMSSCCTESTGGGHFRWRRNSGTADGTEGSPDRSGQDWRTDTGAAGQECRPTTCQARHLRHGHTAGEG